MDSKHNEKYEKALVKNTTACVLDALDDLSSNNLKLCVLSHCVAQIAMMEGKSDWAPSIFFAALTNKVAFDIIDKHACKN
jgi:hypothetical protein